VDKPDRPSFFSAYLSFLVLFWMTAPLAWLYAIPYERFLSPADAVRANLWTLGLVAAWRVALMVRVLTVLMGYTVAQAIFLVMGFADAVALLAIQMMPRPVVGIMGGIRHTETEEAILRVTCAVTGWGCLSLPVWLIGALIASASSKPSWQVPSSAAGPAAAPNRGLLALAVTALVVWIPLLPWTQAEQLLRHTVELDLRGGRVVEALAIMSAHAPSDFPPLWDPPPRVGYGESRPPLMDVLEAIADQPPAPWVRQLYVEKLRQYFGNKYAHPPVRDAGRIARLFQRLEGGPALTTEFRDELEQMLRYGNEISERDKDDLKALLGKNE
jgi:hypothetical protein